MQEELSRNIKKILPLSGNALELFISKFKPLSLKKSEHFIRQNQIHSKIGFILKGAMICYYLKDGGEFVEDFSFESEFVSDYFSILNNIPAQKNIRCIEDTDLAVIDYKDILELYGKNSIAERVGRIIAEGLFMRWQQKHKSFLLEDAMMRYQKLSDKNPELIQRVPQYLLASYLHVQPETLSRIRRKIALG